MTELTKMIGPGGPEDIAICGASQVAEWRGYGYVTEEEAAEAAAKAAEEAAKAAAGKGAKG